MIKYRVLAPNLNSEAVASTISVTGARLTELPDGLPHLRIEPRVGDGLHITTENIAAFGHTTVEVGKLSIKLATSGGLSFNAQGELQVTGLSTGTVTGPANSTDNAIVRWDGTTGQVIQNSLITITDLGSLNVPTGQAYQINGISVLTASALGTGVLSSSLTSVGTLTNLSVANNLDVHNGGLFYDSVNDRLGIGTDQPYATLTIVSQGTGNVRALVGEHYDNATAFSQFKMIGSRARGTRANPTAVLANDSLASFNGRGYKATGWSSTVGGVYIYAAENWTDTATGTFITLRGATPGGTTVSEWARFTHVGLQIGDITGLSSAALRIGGDIRASGTIYATDFVLTGGAGSGVGISLDNLDDVVITAAVAGEYLRYNGTNWVDSTIQTSDLGSGTANTTTFLRGDRTWAVASLVGVLDDLTDVAITSATQGQVLRRGATEWVNATLAIADISGLQTALDGKQAADADLTAIAALAGTSGFLKKTAADTWSLDTNTYLTGNQTITLSGGATGSGTTAITVTLSNTAVTGQVLTGYTVGANTALAATDTILGAFQKVQGQINNRLPLTGGTITGTVTVQAAATQDAVRLVGRAGGTSSYYVSITPTTLSANRTLTLANGDTTLVAGTMVPNSLSLTLNGTTGEIEVTGGAQDLSANRTWTIGLPDNVDIATSLDVGSVSALAAAAMRVGGDIRASGTIYATDFVLTGGAGSGVGINLDNLDDVVITAAAAGEYLRFNGTNWVDSTIQTADLGSGTANSTTFLRGDRTWAVASLVGVLDDLTDVAITSATQGQVLRRGATEWVNSALAIADVTGLQTALDGKQAADDDLTAIAALTGTAGFLKKTAANAWALDTNTYLTGNQTITLSGGATGSGTTAITVTLSNTAVTGQALTGYTVGTNTALAATDTILGAFQKVQGQINARLTGNQTITLSGDATGSGATAIAVTLKNTGTAGTYTKVTTDAQGRVTSGTTLAAGDIPTLSYLPLVGGTLTGALVVSDALGTTTISGAGMTTNRSLAYFATASAGQIFNIQTDTFRVQNQANNATLFSVTSSGASVAGSTVLHAGNYGSYALPLAGGTVTGSITVRPAATQDAVILAGRAGGTGTFGVTITPTTLTANRTLTLANGDTILVAGTMVPTTRTLTISGTTGEIEVDLAGAQDLSGNRSWTIGLPDNVDIATSLDVGSVGAIAAAAMRVGGDIRASGTIYATDFVLTGGAGSGVGITLDNLDDVVITSASNGQILQYNGTNWVNISAQFGSQLTVFEETTSLTTNASSLKFVGGLVTATNVGNDITVTVATPSWADITAKPTTLSGFGITDAQPLDADLTSIAGLGFTSTAFLKKTAANTWALDTNTYLTGNQTITLSGGATGSGTTAITVTLSNTAVTGQALTGYAVGTNTALAATDTILQAFQKVQGQINARITGNQTITLSGDVTGSGTTAITATLANSGVSAGTYRSVTVNTKGLVTGGTNPTTLAGYGITDAATTAHKYHAFGSGQYFYDNYEQANNFRLFTENATFSTSRYRPVSNIEYWDQTSSVWVSWSAAQSSIESLLDGREETGMSVAHANRKFRFVVSVASGWPTLMLYFLQTTWSAITYPSMTVTLESATSAGGTYTLRDTAVFSGANTGSNWGIHARTTSALHTGDAFVRVTIDITDWVDSGAYTTVPLRRFEMLSNYAGGVLLPFSWNYSRAVTFPSTVTATTFSGPLSGNATTATTLQTARNINGVSFNGGANISIPTLQGTNGTTTLATTGVTSAVNYISMTNAAAGGAVTLSTDGTDTNIGLNITTKGTGAIVIDTGTGAGQIDLKPGSSHVRFWDDDSSHYWEVLTGNVSANYSLTLPAGNVTLVAGTMVPTTGTGATGTWGISISGSAATLTTGRTIAMTGDVTWTSAAFNGSGSVTGVATLTNTAVTGQVLTGYAVGTNTALAATDTILGAFQKVQGQINNRLALSGGTITGTVTVQAAATQDAVRLQGRAGGTGSFVVTVTPTTLSANRTLTLANGDTTLVAGTMVPNSVSLTINGTANQISVTGGTLDLSASRTWTIALPNSVAITTSLDVGSVGAITAATMRVGGDIRASGTIYASDFVLTGGAGSGVGISLDNLDDVVITAAAAGEYLRYNGTSWVDSTIQTADLGTGTANSTTFLRGDRTWAVASLVGVLTDLTDVSITSPATNQILSYNGSQWVNTATPTVTSLGLGAVAQQGTGSLTTSTTTANQVVLTLSATTYRSVKLMVQAVSGTSYQVSELLLVHDGTTVSLTEYGLIHTSASPIASFNVDISGGNLRLLVTPVNAATTIKATTTAMTAA